MSQTIRRALYALAVLALSACSAPSPQERIEATQRDAMAPLKAHYAEIVTGFDFQGNTLNVSIDPNAALDLDDDQEKAMRAEALRDWRGAWLRAHPNEHAQLTVRIIDFRGTQYWKGTTKA